MKSIRRIFQHSIVVFIAGFILNAAIDIALGDVANKNVGIILAIFTIFILYTVATLRETNININSQVAQLGLTSTWISDPKEAYERVTEIVHSAQNSILALSLYMPSKHRLKLPLDRPKYLEAIEQIIERRLADETRS